MPMQKQRMTAAEYNALISKPSKSKFNNKRVTVDNITFDSIMESDRYNELLMLERAGEIQGFGRQPSFIIDDSGSRYRPDFIVCGKGGDIWVEDVKGMETAEFKRKKRQWEQAYPWLPLVLLKK